MAVGGVLSVVSVLSVGGIASAAWTHTSPPGLAGASATTLSAPGNPVLSKVSCNGGNNHYTARATFTNSTSSFASSSYTVLYGTTSGGPYSSSFGSGTSPVTSASNAFATNTNYYVIVEATVGTNWVKASPQSTLNFSCP